VLHAPPTLQQQQQPKHKSASLSPSALLLPLSGTITSPHQALRFPTPQFLFQTNSMSAIRSCTTHSFWDTMNCTFTKHKCHDYEISTKTTSQYKPCSLSILSIKNGAVIPNEGWVPLQFSTKQNKTLFDTNCHLVFVSELLERLENGARRTTEFLRLIHTERQTDRRTHTHTHTESLGLITRDESEQRDAIRNLFKRRASQ
jgi:hypothetical protein